MNIVAEPNQGKADRFSGVYECVGPVLPERNLHVVIPNKYNELPGKHNLEDKTGVLVFYRN